MRVTPAARSSGADSTALPAVSSEADSTQRTGTPNCCASTCASLALGPAALGRAAADQHRQAAPLQQAAYCRRCRGRATVSPPNSGA
jgi:hypothetical protein